MNRYSRAKRQKSSMEDLSAAESLRHSYVFDESSLTQSELSLWRQMPDDYRAFIQKNNGGKLLSRRNRFYTGLPFIHEPGLYSNAGALLDQFYGFISYENEIPNKKTKSLLHEYHQKHAIEQFLPDNVYIFAETPTTRGRLAISLNESDYGVIYFSDWILHYSHYFYSRIREAGKKFDCLTEAEKDLSRERYNAVNYAKLVAVAESFDAFMKSLRDQAAEDEQKYFDDSYFNPPEEDGEESVAELICESNNIKAVEKMLDSGVDINRVYNDYGHTLLIEAVRYDRLSIVKLLVERGAYVNSAVSWLKSCSRESREIARIILKNSTEYS